MNPYHSNKSLLESVFINNNSSWHPSSYPLLSHLQKHPHTKLAIQLSCSALIPAIPILYWSHNSQQDREERHQEVSTRLGWEQRSWCPMDTLRQIPCIKQCWPLIPHTPAFLASKITCSLATLSHQTHRRPSVQTIDDLMVEKCQPGDVMLFDRRCECCASGAAAAMGCLLWNLIRKLNTVWGGGWGEKCWERKLWALWWVHVNTY